MKGEKVPTADNLEPFPTASSAATSTVTMLSVFHFSVNVMPQNKQVTNMVETILFFFGGKASKHTAERRYIIFNSSNDTGNKKYPYLVEGT